MKSWALELTFSVQASLDHQQITFLAWRELRAQRDHVSEN